jgi:hypothetical protein
VKPETVAIPREVLFMRRYFPLLILMICRHVGAEEPAAPPPILVFDAGGHASTAGPGTLLLVLNTGGHIGTITSVMFTPDGRELISTSDRVLL